MAVKKVPKLDGPDGSYVIRKVEADGTISKTFVPAKKPEKSN